MSFFTRLNASRYPFAAMALRDASSCGLPSGFHRPARMRSTSSGLTWYPSMDSEL